MARHAPETCPTLRRNPRPGPCRHVCRGTALIYLTVAMVALTAFSSLAVDLGRVYVARAELQLAADAAARHGAAGLKQGVSTARSNAVAAAADNTADGQSVVLDPSKGDVEFGTWDAASRTFTVLTGSAQSSANAIRVNVRRTAARGNAVPLLWGAMVGARTCNVSVSAIARGPTAAGRSGFMGIGNISVGNNSLIAGYDSAAGPPGGANLNDEAAVGSNDEVEIGNNTTVRGDVLAEEFDAGGGGTVSGDVIDNLPPMSYPPTETPGIASAGSLDVPDGQTVTLAAGTHYYNTVTMGNNATLAFAGQATMYVGRSIDLGNRSSVIAPGNLPANLKLRLLSGASFEAGNNPLVIADVYGPRSEFEAGNNAEFRGALVAEEVEFGNNATLYYDRKLGGGAGGPSIMLVR